MKHIFVKRKRTTLFLSIYASIYTMLIASLIVHEYGSINERYFYLVDIWILLIVISLMIISATWLYHAGYKMLIVMDDASSKSDEELLCSLKHYDLKQLLTLYELLINKMSNVLRAEIKKKVYDRYGDDISGVENYDVYLYEDARLLNSEKRVKLSPYFINVVEDNRLINAMIIDLKRVVSINKVYETNKRKIGDNYILLKYKDFCFVRKLKIEHKNIEKLFNYLVERIEISKCNDMNKRNAILN